MRFFTTESRLLPRIAVTLGALIAFRLCAQLPLPGLDLAGAAELLEGRVERPIGILAVLSGGSYSWTSLFSAGLLPYFAAVALATLGVYLASGVSAIRGGNAVPIEPSARTIAVLSALLAALQGYAYALSLQSTTLVSGPLVLEPGPLFLVSTAVGMAAATLFLVWLARIIDAHGVGGGITMLLFAGISAEILPQIAVFAAMARTTESGPAQIRALIAVVLVSVPLIVFFELARRQAIQVRQGEPHETWRWPTAHRLNPGGALPLLLGLAIQAWLYQVFADAENAPLWIEAAILTVWSGGLSEYAIFTVLILGFAFAAWQGARLRMRHAGAPEPPYALLPLSCCFLILVWAAPMLAFSWFELQLSFYGLILLILTRSAMDFMSDVKADR